MGSNPTHEPRVHIHPIVRVNIVHCVVFDESTILPIPVDNNRGAAVDENELARHKPHKLHLVTLREINELCV